MFSCLGDLEIFLKLFFELVVRLDEHVRCDYGLVGLDQQNLRILLSSSYFDDLMLGSFQM